MKIHNFYYYNIIMRLFLDITVAKTFVLERCFLILWYTLYIMYFFTLSEIFDLIDHFTSIICIHLQILVIII